MERYATPNFTPGRNGDTVRLVVVHTTDGSFRDTVAWFGNPESRVSAHYLVGLSGRVIQFVAEEDTARHAGRVREPTADLPGPDPNLYSVGIEFEDGGDPMTVARPDEQYRAGADLLAGIARRWDVPLDRAHVLGHREVFRAKLCPGNLDIDRLLREAAVSAS